MKEILLVKVIDQYYEYDVGHMVAQATGEHEWVQMEDEEASELREAVNYMNRSCNRAGMDEQYVVIEKPQQEETIQHVFKTVKEFKEAQMKKIEAERKKKEQERELRKQNELAKKQRQLEKLKKELGEA